MSYTEEIGKCRECGGRIISEVRTCMVQIDEDKRGNAIGEEQVVDGVEYCENCGIDFELDKVKHLREGEGK